MASNAIQYSVGMDCSKGIASGKQFISVTQDMGKKMQEVFGSKLKSLISVAAIEEAVRRTGEWAVEITQTARALGLTTENLQTLNRIATKTGTAESTVQGMFESIKNAANAAISGNAEMINSFAMLGVHIDSASTVADVFQQTMDKLPSPEVLNNANSYFRNAVQTVTGVSGQTAAGFAQGYREQPGSTMAEKANGLLNSGSIASGEQISSIASTWSAIKTDLSDAGKMLLPIAGWLMDVVHWLTTALAGLVEGLTGLGEAIIGPFKGDMAMMERGTKKWVGIVVNGLIAILNFIPSTIASVMTKIPGLKKYGEKYQKNTEAFKADVNEKFGINPETARRGEAVGDAALMALTAGEFAAVGPEAKAAARAAFREAGGGEAGIAAAKRALQAGRMAGAAEIGDAAIIAAHGASGASGGATRTTPPMDERLLRTSRFMQPLGGGATGSGNIKIGGMFGSGEVQIIKLTERMINLLSQIVTNTAPWNGNPNRMTGQGGGQGVAGGR